jgi:hypothetical protein
MGIFWSECLGYKVPPIGGYEGGWSLLAVLIGYHHMRWPRTTGPGWIPALVTYLAVSCFFWAVLWPQTYRPSGVTSTCACFMERFVQIDPCGYHVVSQQYKSVGVWHVHCVSLCDSVAGR